jgi:hypothetical protein
MESDTFAGVGRTARGYAFSTLGRYENATLASTRRKNRDIGRQERVKTAHIRPVRG